MTRDSEFDLLRRMDQHTEKQRIRARRLMLKPLAYRPAQALLLLKGPIPYKLLHKVLREYWRRRKMGF